MNLKLSFSWVGLVIFALPMLINIAYALFPPAGEASPAKSTPRWLEAVEDVSRIAYLIVITFFVGEKPLDLKSAWFYISIAFLVLYYIAWIRYFACGRDTALLGKAFLFVPMPLAVFPVLYFLCAAIWMHNLPAAIVMVIFGAAHITVSVRSFR